MVAIQPTFKVNSYRWLKIFKYIFMINIEPTEFESWPYQNLWNAVLVGLNWAFFGRISVADVNDPSRSNLLNSCLWIARIYLIFNILESCFKDVRVDVRSLDSSTPCLWMCVTWNLISSTCSYPQLLSHFSLFLQGRCTHSRCNALHQTGHSTRRRSW